MSDQKKLVRRGGGGGGTGGMMIEEPPLTTTAAAATSAKDTAPIAIHPSQVANDLAAVSPGGGSGGGDETEPLSIERRYSEERMAAKVRHWREGELAAGLVEVTWRDELGKHRYADTEEEDANGPNRGVCADCCREDMEPTCGCLYLSGIVCSRIGAGRVGNMAILKESVVIVEEEINDVSDDEEEQMESEHGSAPPSSSGSVRTRKVHKRRIDLIVGPYWPMLMCVTYPLIFGISFWTFVSAILPGRHPLIVLVWFALTISLIYSLFGVAFRDPGILPRHRTPPSGTARGEWRWNDQAQTYRPRGAIYDPDCSVVIEEFDHTCPWTGTAIGKGNVTLFNRFGVILAILFAMDVMLLVMSSLPKPQKNLNHQLAI